MLRHPRALSGERETRSDRARQDLEDLRLAFLAKEERLGQGEVRAGIDQGRERLGQIGFLHRGISEIMIIVG